MNFGIISRLLMKTYITIGQTRWTAVNIESHLPIILEQSQKLHNDKNRSPAQQTRQITV